MTVRAQERDSLWEVWSDRDQPDSARMKAMDYLTFDHYMLSLIHI